MTPLRLFLETLDAAVLRRTPKHRKNREPAGLARPHIVALLTRNFPLGDRDHARVLVDALIAALSA